MFAVADEVLVLAEVVEVAAGVLSWRRFRWAYRPVSVLNAFGHELHVNLRSLS